MEFTQKSFNELHKEPRDYGEGDYYIVSGEYTAEQAAKLIGEWESGLTGEKRTFKPEEVYMMQMYVSNKNDDGTDDWCVNNWSDEKPVAIGLGVSN